MPQEAAALESVRAESERTGPPRPTPLGRVVVGTVVALGSYLGLRKVAAGVLLAGGSDPAEWWLTVDGLAAVFGLQTAAALFGAMLTGAGRPRGFLLGLAVGGLCGGLFLGAELLAGAPPWQLVLYTQPLILAVGGGVLGALGVRIWPPAPAVDMPLPAPSKLSSIQLGMDRPTAAERPTAWLRVLIGAAVMVAGVGLADEVRQGAQRFSGGMLKVSSRAQGRFLSWQFATLAILGGGAAAGAGTGAGRRHGAFAGFLGAAGVVGLTATRAEPTQGVIYWLDKLNFSTFSPDDPGSVAAVAGGVLLAGLVGGWLGAALFLPLAPPHMRNRRLKAGD